MRTFGCIKSNLIGNEYTYSTVERINLPETYQLSNLPPVIDQGDDPICVSASLADMVRYQLNYKNTKLKLKDSIFFDNDPTASKNGMMPKSAFEVLLSDRISELAGKFKFYAKVPSSLVLKNCILSHGPVMVCLPARSYTDNFWLGNELLGGHAVTFVGWTENAFILKNSWGVSYGYNGYHEFGYEFFDLIYECWTLII